jgi:hypothetical protein
MFTASSQQQESNLDLYSKTKSAERSPLPLSVQEHAWPKAAEIPTDRSPPEGRTVKPKAHYSQNDAKETYLTLPFSCRQTRRLTPSVKYRVARRVTALWIPQKPEPQRKTKADPGKVEDPPARSEGKSTHQPAVNGKVWHRHLYVPGLQNRAVGKDRNHLQRAKDCQQVVPILGVEGLRKAPASLNQTGAEKH